MNQSQTEDGHKIHVDHIKALLRSVYTIHVPSVEPEVLTVASQRYVAESRDDAHAYTYAFT